jgi:hypothetical protein
VLAPLLPNDTRRRPAAETRPDSTQPTGLDDSVLRNFKGAGPFVGAPCSRTSCFGRVRRACPTRTRRTATRIGPPSRDVDLLARDGHDRRWNGGLSPARGAGSVSSCL